MDCRDSWTELFDVVIAKANKPQFYTSEHPFRFVSYTSYVIWCSFFILIILYILTFFTKDDWDHCATF